MTLNLDVREFDLASHMGAVCRHFLGEPNPAHSKSGELRWGTHGSLSVDLAKGTWYDHEGGEGGGVLDLVVREASLPSRAAAAQYMRDNLDLPLPAPLGLCLSQPRRRVVATYEYPLADGTPHRRVARTEPKGFYQQHHDGQTWCNGKGPGPNVVYRLPDLAQEMESAPHATVHICEGEKCADALCDLGLIATTAAEGAGKWTAELNAWFAKRNVCILPDNDPPGERHAQDVARNLHGVADSVRIVRLPNLLPKGDVVDWLAAGGDRNALAEIIRNAPIWTPDAPVPLSHFLGGRDSGTATAALKVDTLAGLECAVLPKRDHILRPILHCRSLAMVYAPRGFGKTLVAHGIGYAVASGGSFLRWQADKPRRVLLIDGEMPAELLQERSRTMRAGANFHPPADDYFRLIAMDRQDLGITLNLASLEHQALIEAHLDGAELVILDNISTLVHGGRENDAESWDTMQPWLLKLRRKGVSVLLIAHAGRGENARGTSKREDVLDTVVQLRRPQDYEAEEGARFEVRITKGRGVFGDDAAAFEAKLEIRDGADFWSATTITDLAFEQVLELTRAKKSVRDIGEELSLSKSRVQRIQAKARAEGML